MKLKSVHMQYSTPLKSTTILIFKFSVVKASWKIWIMYVYKISSRESDIESMLEIGHIFR